MIQDIRPHQYHNEYKVVEPRREDFVVFCERGTMLVKKEMEEITFLHWWKDNTYKSEVYNIPTGIISHVGGSDWALSTYKVMVNDTIANALDTIQCKLVPYNDEWNTGISIPVANIEESNTIFPVQIYDWITIKEKIQEYVHCVMQVI